MKSLLHALRGKRTLVFIDFEGTQFSHEIIATGIVKARIDENGYIIDYEPNGLLTYTKPHSSVGKIVTKITSLTDEFVQNEGHDWSETIKEIENYIGEDLDDALFVCFGSNDPRMILESNRFSHPENEVITKKWLSKFFDLMTFISQYIRDEKGNTYSLVNFLKLYGIEPKGTSHNPLNDAFDLMNLYQAFISNPEIVFNEYQKVLKKMKMLPAPVKEIVESLIDGKDVTSEEFKKKIKKFLA